MRNICYRWLEKGLFVFFCYGKKFEKKSIGKVYVCGVIIRRLIVFSF